MVFALVFFAKQFARKRRLCKMKRFFEIYSLMLKNVNKTKETKIWAKMQKSAKRVPFNLPFLCSIH